MNSNPLDLPGRPGEMRPHFSLTEQQTSKLIDLAGEAAGHMTSIVRDIVAIARIRQEADADVRRIGAETHRAVFSIRAEIDRLALVGENVRSRGQVAVDIIRQVGELMKQANLDGAAQARLVDSLVYLVGIACGPESEKRHE